MDFEAAKQQIDLVALAIEGYGYAVVAAKSTARQVVLRHPEYDEHLVVNRRSREGNPWYFNPHDERDRGTVIDFLLRREGGDWSRIKALLAAHLRAPPSVAPFSEHPPAAPPAASPILPDFSSALSPLTHRQFLYRRGFSDATLDHPWFRGRIGQWERNGYPNVAFPLYRGPRIVGLELRNAGFKGYASGSRKHEGCWFSAVRGLNRAPDALLICESALDALAFHQLLPPQRGETRVYLSTGGSCAPGQQALVQGLIDSLQPRAVWLAADRDAAGQQQHLRWARHLSHPLHPQQPLYRLWEQLEPQRIRLSLAFGEQEPMRQQALVLLLSGLAQDGAIVRGPTWTEGRQSWRLDLPRETELLTKATRLLIHLQGQGPWLKLKLPQTKDWNEDLLSPRG